MEQTSEQKIYYTLRLAMAMCFIGHGAFGIITKPIWCNYFAVFGIDADMAYRLMPPVGLIDILMGLSIILYSTRIIALWLLFWGLMTAMLRPLSGEPFAEFVERAGNYGAPLAMLLLTGFHVGQLRKPFTLLKPPVTIDVKRQKQVAMALRIIVFMLLAGHGWLNLLEKKALLAQYSSLGFSAPMKVAITVGVLECIAAVGILIKPMPKLLLLIFVWKMASELFYPHYELFEWIERGGSYGCILALYFATRKPAGLRVPSAKSNFSMQVS